MFVFPFSDLPKKSENKGQLFVVVVVFFLILNFAVLNKNVKIKCQNMK